MIDQAFKHLGSRAIVLAALAMAIPTTSYAVSCTAKSGGPTVSECIIQAQPGDTVTIVGTHIGSINLSGKKGTKEKPIRLIGSQGGRIIGTLNTPAVSGQGVDYVEIRGLRITSNISDVDVDGGAIKFLGSWTDPSEGIVIAGNLIDGTGRDGMKLFQNVAHFAIVGNTFNGAWRQETIDCFSCRNGLFAFNTVAATNKSYFNDLSTKGGAHHIVFRSNQFNQGLNCGGFGNSGPYVPRGPDAPNEPPADWNTQYYMAKNLTFINNVAESVRLAGCWDSTIVNNSLKYPTISSAVGANQTQNKNNTIGNNAAGAFGQIGVVGWTRSSSGVPGPTDVFAFTAMHSGLCLDVTGFSTAEGAEIQQWGCGYGSNQRFRLLSAGSGTYRIQAVNSNKCFDLPNEATANGTPVKQSTCDTNKSQLFTMVSYGGAYVRFRSAFNTARCLDIKNASTANGGDVQIFNCDMEKDNQLFKIIDR